VNFDYLIAIDWGSTNWRAFLLNAAGELCETLEQPLGIRQIQKGEYATVLQRALSDWLARYPRTPIILSGMIGSRNGWAEVPYVSCPASLQSLAAHLHPLPALAGHSLWIVPGVSCSENDSWDVMRGEETQLIGAEIQEPAWFCLPGTHSKWVQWSDQTITRIMTAVTGELYAVLRQHSLLGEGITTDELDEPAFTAGLQRAAHSRGLLTELFSVRTAGLFNQWPQAALASYFSGILIGHELSAQLPRVPETTPLYLIASSLLTRRYMTACTFYGRKALVLRAEAVTARGLFLLAKQAK
jgi:2-dehydro-3-deoxygalactonokinase